ncbi:adenosylcobinamide amidohydrolase [Paenibacillus hexagrammi]|uniref:Adenosylcobinamide amidohydrolase n=1 Tax=Paenibacillus hexagrammi TaxID=2908839 RepID=A0ABY3SQW8_9BACL|nr:adenosylcobinamide amidohydrolase [Paenibacillus sp. YPD9-1]UJF36389.1 adenosylcobinamide amidohydrolase [Paenibacillus sp. YPD9-1]
MDKHYQAEDPVGEMNEFLTLEGFNPQDCASMLTAAYVKQAGCFTLSTIDIETDRTVQSVSDEDNRLQVTSCVTSGFSNKARAGSRTGNDLYPGTINIMVIVNGCMTDACMANAIITATEAKTAALQDLGVTLDNGKSATGTTTDAVLIAATGRGRVLHYAGTATQLGYLLGKTVYDGLIASGRLCI